jgi:uncharacterized MAPEG superfamily protein
MTPELTLLGWSVALLIVQVAVSIAGSMTQFPLQVLVGNRDTPVEGKGWVGRAQRAHRNMIESLLPFAVLVLAAEVAGIANANTVLGAQLYFYGRVAYAALYLAGVPWARTGAWAVSLAGMVLILLQVV